MPEIGVFAMVVLIVLIVTIGRTLRARYQAMGRLPDAASADEAAQLRTEVARLNQRMQVLERLATDPSKRLSDEIDALDRNR